MADTTSDSRNWFLRISSGTIFGPVSTQGLTTWAAQGRVLAGNEISEDRKQWQPAEGLAELDISWYIEDGEGLLDGPFHRRVAEKIIATNAGHGGGRLIPAAEADLGRVRQPAATRLGADRAGGQPDGAQTYPPYNIERTGDNAYRISVAVSGFAPNELSIVARENTLTINVEKDLTITAKGKTTVKSTGAISIKSDADVSIEGKNLNLKAQSNAKLEATANIDLKATAQLNLKGMKATVQGDTMTEVKSNAMVQVQSSGMVKVAGNPIMLN